MLLHICSETRALALAYYELTFGNKNCPALAIPGTYVHDYGFSINGVPYTETYEVKSNAAEVAALSPKVYINFTQDIVLFGYHLPLPPHEEILQCWPFSESIDPGILRRIEKLSLSIDVAIPSYYFLNNKVDRWPRLRDLYIHLDPATDDSSTINDIGHLRGELELVDLTRDLKKDEEYLAQKFVDKYRAVIRGRGLVFNGEGVEGVKMICKEGLNNLDGLRGLLLRNGADPEALLKCVFIRSRAVPSTTERAM